MDARERGGNGGDDGMRIGFAKERRRHVIDLLSADSAG